jgi:hypothetical protein
LYNFIEDWQGLSSYLDSLARKDLHQRQEVMVFYYAALLIKNIDEFEESRIMPALRSSKFLILGLKFVNKYQSVLPGVTLLKCVEALSIFVDSEEFQTYRAEHIDFTNEEDINEMISLKEKCLSEIMKDMENRKIVRPLVDAIEKAKRTFMSSSRK